MMKQDCLINCHIEIGVLYSCINKTIRLWHGGFLLFSAKNSLVSITRELRLRQTSRLPFFALSLAHFLRSGYIARQKFIAKSGIGARDNRSPQISSQP